MECFFPSLSPLSSWLIPSIVIVTAVRATLMANASVDGLWQTRRKEGPIRVDRFKKHNRPLTARDYFNSSQIGREPVLVICFEIVSSKWVSAEGREREYSLSLCARRGIGCRPGRGSSWTPGREARTEKDEREEPYKTVSICPLFVITGETTRIGDCPLVYPDISRSLLFTPKRDGSGDFFPNTKYLICKITSFLPGPVSPSLIVLIDRLRIAKQRRLIINVVKVDQF